MKLKIYAIMILILIPLALGIETLGDFDKGENIELIQICSNCSFINITSIRSPNSSIIFTNLEMSKYGEKFNYTLPPQSLKGNYQVCGLGDVNGNYQVWCYDFNIVEKALEYDKDIIRDSRFFNLDILNLNTLSGAIMFIFLILMFGFLIMLTESLKIGVLALLTGIYGIFLSFLMYSSISVILGIILVLISLIYMVGRTISFTS